MSTDIQKGSSILRPRARLIKTIGEELISNDIVAILELVKNSYDADSSIIEIEFSGKVNEIGESEKKKKKVLLRNGASIIISDDGSGMSLTTIKDAWMEPATIMKKVSKTSPLRARRYTGEKGIGRFASAKLSEKLQMITKTDNDNEVVVNFDWTDFEKNEKYLDEVKCSWEVREPSEINKSGTILRLTNLNTEWDEEKLRTLRVTLSRLINPVSPIEDFLIELQLPSELSDLSGLISAPDSINRPDYMIKGSVDENGQAEIEYKSKNQTTSITYIKDINKELSPIRSFQAGPFGFEFRVWDREQDSLERLAREIGSTTKNIKEDLKDLAGVSIYRDHFRILPYGEPNNDWLRLDHRRVNNPTLRLSNNQIIGYVSVSLDTNPDFKDQSNREGIVDSQAFNDLKETIKVLLSELEEKRYKERPRKDEDAPQESLFSKFSLSPIKEIVGTKLKGDKEAERAISETEEKINEGVHKVKSIISRYRRLSTLGLLIDVVLHDGNNFLSKIDSETRIAQKEMSKENPDQDKINKHHNEVLEQRNILSQLFKRLEPFGGRKRGRPKDIIIENSISNVFELYKSELQKLKINFDLPDSENYVKIDEGELQMILVNLLQNSIFWLEKIEDNRQIKVEIAKNSEELSIIFSDNGPGVEEDKAPFIFDPYFSSKTDGIGLGLTIVGEIVSEYNGELQLIDNGPLEGATFEIIFRKRV